MREWGGGKEADCDINREAKYLYEENIQDTLERIQGVTKEFDREFQSVRTAIAD